MENPQIRDGRTALVLAIKANTLTGGSATARLERSAWPAPRPAISPTRPTWRKKHFDLANAAKLKKLGRSGND